MTFAEQLGLDRLGTCWCCGGLGQTVDDWDAVEPCLFCDGTGTPASRFRQPLANAEMQAIDDEMGKFEDGDRTA